MSDVVCSSLGISCEIPRPKFTDEFEPERYKARKLLFFIFKLARKAAGE
jgi:hypothetical protein